MSTANRIIKNTGFLYAKMGITMFISLYTTRVVLNALGVSDFGIFNIVGGAIAMLGFLNGAMATATQRFMSFSQGEGNRHKQKVIFNISVVLHFFIALLLGGVLLLMGYLFFNGILKIDSDRFFAAQVIYGSLIISTMFTVATVPYDAVLNANENMLYYAIIGIIESVLKLAVAFAIYFTSGDKLVWYGVLMACIPIITMTIMRVYCHRKYSECDFSPKNYWDKPLMREMSKFAGWNLLTSASGIVSQYGMGIVLNHFWGTLLNAAQGIANQISGQLMTFSHVVLKALNPVISKNEGSGNRELVIRATFAGCKFSFLLFSLFSIPFIVEAPYILRIWLAQVPEWAVVFCRLQLLRILAEQLTISIGSSIQAQGNIKQYSKIRGVLNILPIILTTVFFYFNYPPYMLYIVWIVCWSILGGSLGLYFAHKNIGLSYKAYIQAVLLPCIATTTIVFLGSSAIAYTLEEGVIRLIFIGLISVLLHAIVGWYLGVNKDERWVLINLIKKASDKFSLKLAKQ